MSEFFCFSSLSHFSALLVELITNIYFVFSVHKNCAEVCKAGKRISGVYTIDPDNAGAFDVFCDQTTAGGGVDSVPEETEWLG